MAKGINQKGKILYLEKILRETSETHPCTMPEIIGRLQENGVSAERKSIYDDMEVLRSFGMDIKFKRGKYTGYYVAGEVASESVNTSTTEKAFPSGDGFYNLRCHLGSMHQQRIFIIFQQRSGDKSGTDIGEGDV